MINRQMPNSHRGKVDTVRHIVSFENIVAYQYGNYQLFSLLI